MPGLSVNVQACPSGPDGVRTGGAVYHGGRRSRTAARDSGSRPGVVSSSADIERVLGVTGLDKFFDVKVDGVNAEQHCLRGAPALDTFRFAAARPGVDRAGRAEALKANGADVVGTDLAELLERT